MDKTLLPTAVICLSDGAGGMEHDAVKLADLLSHRSDTVLICKQNTFIEQLYEKGNYSFECESISFTNKSFSFSMFIKTHHVLNRYSIKNVIYFGASELKTLYFSFIGKGLNVIVRHGTTKSSPKRDWFHRLIYSCVNYHVAISMHLLNNVKQIVPADNNEKFKIIYPSFSFDEVKRETCSVSDKIHIIHIGRLARGKGQIDAIHACRALYDRRIEFELRFLGDSKDESYVAEIKQALHDLPYADKVKFAGYVDDVGKSLVNADIFLYPSYGEGFGNVFVEAMGFGLSVVTYNNTTFPEFARMGFRFYMADNRNIVSLSDCLLRAADEVLNHSARYEGNSRLAAELFNKDRELLDWHSILC
ncbi:MAG: glycosyltransferase family 4 protein [Gammaproteobacteria bacterium]